MFPGFLHWTQILLLDHPVPPFVYPNRLISMNPEREDQGICFGQVEAQR